MPQADATDRAASIPEEALIFTGSFIVRIAALVPKRVIAATVTPLNLASDECTLKAIVGWEGIETVSTTVGTQVEPGLEESDHWVRFLQLLWVVLGPTTLPEPEEFGPGRWSSIVLSTQELDGELQHSVVVVVDRARETARIIRSDPARQDAEARMPDGLSAIDAGTALVEMTSRLILGRPWR